jgi:hypothetical protein
MAIGYYIASVKISKQNVTGDDISSNVSELLRFTLNYSDIDPITFEILSKVEYSTYYQLQVKFQGYGNINTLAASNNNYTRDYTLSAEFNASQTSSILIYDNVTTGNSLGYYNSSNGEYTLGYTPNTTLYATASALIYSTAGSPDAQLIFAKQLAPSTYQTILSTSPTLVPPASFINFELSGSFTPINGETYITYVTDSTTSDLTSSLANFYINQLESANTGTSGSGNDVILYIAGDNNENPLYGNAENVVENPHYSKVDYIEYILPEKDFEIILSGLGTKSNVSQYNYELLRSTYPRYVGSRTISPGFNLDTYPVGALPLDTYGGGLGLKPNVERTTPYFLYFTKFISNNPLYKMTTSLQLKYMIDENGEVYNLSTNDDTYYNLIDGFETDKRVYLNLATGNSSFFSTPKTILLSGLVYKPILYSLSSSAGGTAIFTNKLEFTNAKGTVLPSAPDFAFSKSNKAGGSDNWKNSMQIGIAGVTSVQTNYGPAQFLTSSQAINPFYFGTGSTADYPYQPYLSGYDSQSGWIPNPFGIPTVPPSPGYDHISYPRYKFNVQPQTSVNIDFYMYIHNGSYGLFPGGSGGASATLYNTRIQLSIYRIRAGIHKRIAAVQHSIQPFAVDNVYRCELKNYFDFNDQDEIYPVVEWLSGNTVSICDYIKNYGNYNTWFNIKTNGLEAPSVLEPFWTTGSINDTVLTSSVSLGTILNGGYQQVDITSSGLPLIDSEAMIYPGDEIRFEYDESLAYKVVATSSTIIPVPGITASSTLDIIPFYNKTVAIGSSSFDLTETGTVTFSLVGPLTNNTASYDLDITPFHTQVVAIGSSSFKLFQPSQPQINIVLTGSAGGTNDATNIYVPSGSSISDSIDKLVLAINNSSSIAPYATSIGDMSASINSPSLRVHAKTQGIIGNSYSLISGSTTFNFAGAINRTNDSTNIFVLSGSNSITSTAAIVEAINYSSSVAPYNSLIGDISASNTTSTLNLYAKTVGTVGNSYSTTSGSTITYFTDGTNGAPSNSNVAVLYLDRPIPNSPSVNINHFVVRRKVKDVNNGITLNVNVPSSDDSGFLFPEFPTDKIKENLPTIIASLQQKGLI